MESATKKVVEDERLGFLKLVFQATTAPDIVLLNPKEMRTKGISSCGSVVISSSSSVGTQAIFRALSSKAVLPGSLVIGHLHFPNFDKNSLVRITKVPSRYKRTIFDYNLLFDYAFNTSLRFFVPVSITISYLMSDSQGDLPKSVKDVVLSYLLSGLIVRNKQKFTIFSTLVQVSESAR